MIVMQVFWTRSFVLALAILVTIVVCFVIANMDKWLWKP